MYSLKNRDGAETLLVSSPMNALETASNTAQPLLVPLLGSNTDWQFQTVSWVLDGSFCSHDVCVCV